MRKVVKFIIGFLLGLSIYPLFAKGDEGSSFAKYSLGVNAPNQNSISDVKSISVGYLHRLGIFETKIEVGGWADNTGNQDAANSLFGFYSFGLEADLKYFYANFFQGVGGISHTDNVLGGYFQFCEELGIGVRDDRGIGIGAQFKHISDGGLVQPNHGRDFIGLVIQFPW